MRLHRPPSSQTSTASAGTPSGGFRLTPPAPLTILAYRSLSAALAAASASLIEAYASRISLDFGSSWHASFRSTRASANSARWICAVPRRKSALTLLAVGRSAYLSTFVQVAEVESQSSSLSVHCAELRRQAMASLAAAALSSSAVKSYSRSTQPTASEYMAFAFAQSPALKATVASAFRRSASAIFSDALNSHLSFTGAAHESSSTSNLSVAPPGILGGEPCSPYA
mmetsp:Transcript_42502/g.111883  ORF Transcript_42502/g.111883 Transcript_42502/m.111883 type:complete len:227 (+) Transcript_42502:2336-3016(+)